MATLFDFSSHRSASDYASGELMSEFRPHTRPEQRSLCAGNYDIYQRITGQIVAAIESGAAASEWRMPWHTSGDGYASVLPHNVTTGLSYRGVNILALWSAAKVAGYSSPVWGTYRQWNERGAQVRRGERSSPIVFWRKLDGPGQDASEDSGGAEAEERSRRFLARGYAVFNAAQVEGANLPNPAAVSGAQRIAEADVFFSTSEATIVPGDRPCYVPARDLIHMPDISSFQDALSYYATLAHEITHWTGHPQRCARDLTGRFGSESYAAEELVAELGAAFLCGQLGLSAEPRPDHARYVASWLKVLRSDKRAVFTATAKAQQAADWLTQLALV